MTQIIVTDANNTTIVQNPTTAQIITTGAMTVPTVGSMATNSDVDLTNLANGGILVYNTSTSKWTATNLLENQIFEAGQF